MKQLYVLMLLLTVTIFSGCASKPVPILTDEQVENYTPKDIKTAMEYAEDALLRQHRNWAPDSVYFYNDALILDYGSSGTSSSSGMATHFNNGISFTSAKTRYNLSSNVKKFFYSQDSRVSIMPWKRKFKQWYVVSVGNRYVYYTRNVRAALKLQYHLEYVIEHAKKSPVVDKPEDAQEVAIAPVVKKDIAIEDKLLKIKKLHADGLISDEQYAKKKQQLINQY